MEIGAGDRPTGHGPELASKPIQAALVEVVPAKNVWTTAGFCRPPETGSEDGK